jgi:hypothetical protein
MGARIKTYPFNNVQNTGLATCDLNGLLGYTIERIVLVLSGAAFTKSMMTGIQLKANGKVIWDTTGSRVDSRMQYRGITANAGFLTLDFSEIRSKTENGQSLGSIDTTYGDKGKPLSNLKLEVQITGATSPVLTAFAEVSPPQGDPVLQSTRDLVARIHTSQQTIGASGQQAVNVPHLMPSEGGSIFKRIAIFSSQMTGLLVKKNGITVEESTKSLNDFQQNEYKKVPQAGMYMWDNIIDDNQSQAFNSRNAQTIEFLGTFAAGETITVEVEVLEPVSAF